MSTRWQRHALFTFPVLLFFAPVLFFGRALYVRDTGLYFYPHKALIRAALAAGRLPEWNPHEFAGSPLLVDPNYNAFHPLQLACDLLPMPLGFAVFVAANVLLATWGAWFLARRLGLAEWPASLAALVFAWGGTYLSLVEGGQLVAATTLPWLLAALHRVASEPDRRGFALAACASAAMFLAGTPELGFAGFLLGFVLALAAAPALRSALLVVGGALAGALLAAVQVLPSLLYLRHSSRGAGWTFAEATGYSLHPLRLVNLVFPLFLGSPHESGAPTWFDLAGVQPTYIEELAIGLPAALLVIAGWRHWKSRPPRVLLAATVGLAIVALGSHTPVYRALWELLPPLRTIRFPEKFIAPLGLSLALFAGAGAERIALQTRQLRIIAIAAAALVPLTLAVGFAVARGLAPERAECFERTFLFATLVQLAITAVAAELVRRDRPRTAFFALLLSLGIPASRHVDTVPADELASPPTIAAQLQSDEPARFDTTVRLAPTDLAMAADPTWSRARKLFETRRSVLYGALPALHGFEDARGYSGLTNGAMKALFHDGRAELVYDTLGVRWGLEAGTFSGSTYGDAGFRFVGQPLPALRLWENPHALPRLRLVTTVLPDAAEGAIPTCELPAVWIPEDEHRLLPADLPLARSCAKTPENAGSATLTSHEPERVRAHVEAPRPALLVLADAADDGWSVRVDGAESPSFRANGALRAVAVEAGAHELEWRYRTPGLRLGAIVSLFTALALALLGIVRRA